MDIDTKIMAMILVGGLGTRLKPVVSDRPKCLSLVLGRPFITYLLDQLENAGIQSVVLCTGYLAEQVYKTLGYSYNSLSLYYSAEDVPLGTAGAIRHAIPLIDSENILILNGDSYVNLSLKDYLGWVQKRHWLSSLVLVHVQEAGRYGRVVVTSNDQILNFEEKTTFAGPGDINAGIYALKTSILTSIPSRIPCSLEKDVFPQLLKHQLYGYRSTCDFIDIGVPESYFQANRFFQSIGYKSG